METLCYTVSNRSQTINSEAEMGKYFKEGMSSFHICMGRYINPYNSGSHQYNDFERGWTQALKRSSNHIIRSYEECRHSKGKTVDISKGRK